MFFANSNLK